MMSDVFFYDTSSLLLKAGRIFEDGQRFAISSITLEELENIKTANSKSLDVKYAARKLLQDLDEHPDLYETWIYRDYMAEPIEKMQLTLTNDTKILATALDFDKEVAPDETVFVTNDLALKKIANLFFGTDCIASVVEEEDDYCGYEEISMSDEEMSKFYENPTLNSYNLKTNEYIIIKNLDNQVQDKLIWDGQTHQRLKFSSFSSTHFGDVRPLKEDPYQALASDSFLRNKITLLKGPAGSGKTFLSLSFLFSQLERHKIDKIIIFCNTLATKNSARLGFLPGTKDEKLLDSQIGNLLSSKLGDRMELERLIDEGKIVLLPMSDIRGYDTGGMRAGIYITEAQNLDISLMKLALQRIGEDSICIIDGDCKTQVDDINFAGVNNGMRRLSKVFRGEDLYGEVELKLIHRSKIATIAERM